MKQAIIGIGIVLLAVLFLFGCTSPDTTPTVPDTTDTPGSEVATEPIVEQTNEIIETPSDVNIGEMY